MRADPFRPVVPWSTGDQEPARFKPDFQIETTEDGFVFQADLAGIKENEVDIAVTGNRLTISGHIYDARAGSFAGFTRVFTVPEGNDRNDAVRAALDRGVLTVQWSKRLEQAPEAASLPGDDALARWESDGGTTRADQAEPRPWAVEVS
jgi:HSP20 family protein